MTGRVGINFSQTEQLAAALGSASENIAVTLDELDHRLAVLSAEWTGGAAESYAQASAQTAAALREMRLLLSQARETAQVVSDRHREAQTEVDALWG